MWGLLASLRSSKDPKLSTASNSSPQDVKSRQRIGAPASHTAGRVQFPVPQGPLSSVLNLSTGQQGSGLGVAGRAPSPWETFVLGSPGLGRGSPDPPCAVSPGAPSGTRDGSAGSVVSSGACCVHALTRRTILDTSTWALGEWGAPEMPQRHLSQIRPSLGTLTAHGSPWEHSDGPQGSPLRSAGVLWD